MSTQLSGYSGFLDGYKAQNLENVASSANFHIEQINNLVLSLLQKHRESAGLIFLKEVQPIRFSISSLLAIGEALKTTIAYAKTSDQALLAQRELKLLIFHFMEASKLSSDNVVLNLALEIGMLFSSNEP